MSERPTQEELDAIWCELQEDHWILVKRNRWGLVLIGVGTGSGITCLALAVNFFVKGQVRFALGETVLMAANIYVVVRITQIRRRAQRVIRDIEKVLS